MKETSNDVDMETHFKDSFRAFSKDEDGNPFKLKRRFNSKHFPSGCIPAEELKFVMNHLPGRVRKLESLDSFHEK